MVSERSANTGQPIEQSGVQEAEMTVQELLRPGLVAKLALIENGHDYTTKLWPSEAAVMSCSVSSRRQEFALGRRCAREALAELGAPPSAIPVGPSREPILPDGYIGSIAHTAQLVLAVVGSDATCRSVGVDVEQDCAVADDLAGQILTPAEHKRHLRSPELDVITLCFSAKEAVYKTTFPLARQWLGFEQVEINFDFDRHTFEAAIDKRADHSFAGNLLQGRFASSQGHVITIASL